MAEPERRRQAHGQERLGSGGAKLQDAHIQDESSSAAIEANSLDANATAGTFMCTERAGSRLMRRVCFRGVIASKQPGLVRLP